MGPHAACLGVLEKVPGLTVGGLMAQISVHHWQKYFSREVDFVLAGGMENMSQAPHVVVMNEISHGDRTLRIRSI
jgi:acetyl-CoA acetyltransferase